MIGDIIGPGLSNVSGKIQLWRVPVHGPKTLLAAQPNQIQFSWGFIAANQLGRRRAAERLDYAISALYIEYENQDDPEEPVSVASTFNRNLSAEYYNSFADSTTRDFLRVPLIIEPTISVSSGYEANLPVNQQGNQLTFFVQTSGTAGVHGLPFSHVVNSKIFAAALVAAPVFSDRTQDAIFARTVFNQNNQVTKEASAQIGITWDIAFT
jgi:hypothetical protein